MKFNSTNPKIGDRRIIKRFAFLPKQVQNRIVWLESYFVLQQFRNEYVIIDAYLALDGNKDMWVETGRSLKKAELA